jgi:hypothetical protein
MRRRSRSRSSLARRRDPAPARRQRRPRMRPGWCGRSRGLEPALVAEPALHLIGGGQSGEHVAAGGRRVLSGRKPRREVVARVAGLARGEVGVVEVEIADECAVVEGGAVGGVSPPPISVQSGRPPNSSSCARIAVTGGACSAPKAHPSASRTRSFSSSRARSEMSSQERATTKRASRPATVTRRASSRSSVLRVDVLERVAGARIGCRLGELDRGVDDALRVGVESRPLLVAD